MILVLARAQVVERQHRDGRVVAVVGSGIVGAAGADCCDEAIAGAVSRLYIYGLAGVVAQSLTQFLDASGECIVADHRSAPYRFEQLGFGDRFAGARYQLCEHIGSLARELELALVVPQPPRARFETIPAKS
jgi:hypothetical protein